jgi:hypothetical protein
VGVLPARWAEFDKFPERSNFDSTSMPARFSRSPLDSPGRYVARYTACALLCLFESPVSASPVLDFEGLPAMTFFAGNVIADEAKLSDQFLSSYGVTFGTHPQVPDHRMMDFPALRQEWPCGTPGSPKVRSSAS